MKILAHTSDALFLRWDEMYTDDSMSFSDATETVSDYCVFVGAIASDQSYSICL